MAQIDQPIDDRIGEVSTDALDISFGEIISLHSSKELVIQPEYQRLFRWSAEQQSRLIESILLQLPIPQIFVIERANGVFELIDGLQRISSVIHFIDPERLELPAPERAPLELTGCDLIPDLNGKVFEDLSLRLRLRLKRSTVRMVVIRRQSSPMLRYEMFKRLNTGGSLLSPQEIRNCTARILGESGTRFYAFLQECAASSDFQTCTATLPEGEKEQRGDEELVLRFFAVKNARDDFRGSVRDWLDAYMENVVLHHVAFDERSERAVFDRVFGYLGNTMGPGAFVLYNEAGMPVGGLKPAYFEAVTMGVLDMLDELRLVQPGLVKAKLIETVRGTDFREFTGPGANSKPKLEGRIRVVQGALRSLV